MKLTLKKINLLCISAMIIAFSLLLQSEGMAATHKISMAGGVFTPAEITIKAGDTIVWLNDDDTTHKIIFEDKSLGGATVEDTVRIRQKREFSFTFKKAGKYKYYCQPHANQDMRGEIIVTL